MSEGRTSGDRLIDPTRAESSLMTLALDANLLVTAVTKFYDDIFDVLESNLDKSEEEWWKSLRAAIERYNDHIGQLDNHGD